LDGGVSKESTLPVSLIRHPIPNEWRFIIAIPKLEGRITGNEERALLDSVSPPEVGHVSDICRIILLELLPALVERDIHSFGSALTDVQRMVGEVFRPVQGGVYASARLEKLAQTMLDAGAYGVGQSSWGPTIYGLVDAGGRADRVMKALRGELNDGDVFTAEPRNTGANITLEED
jgi:beta-RFAP synthase